MYDNYCEYMTCDSCFEDFCSSEFSSACVDECQYGLNFGIGQSACPWYSYGPDNSKLDDLQNDNGC